MIQRFPKHIFICENQREAGKECCGAKNALDVRKKMKDLLAQKGLHKVYRVNTTGCLDACAQGVTMVIYPQGIWYGHVTCQDVEEIIAKSILGDEIIQRLQLSWPAPAENPRPT